MGVGEGPVASVISYINISYITLTGRHHQLTKKVPKKILDTKISSIGGLQRLRTLVVQFLFFLKLSRDFSGKKWSTFGDHGFRCIPHNCFIHQYG